MGETIAGAVIWAGVIAVGAGFLMWPFWTVVQMWLHETKWDRNIPGILILWGSVAIVVGFVTLVAVAQTRSKSG